MPDVTARLSLPRFSGALIVALGFWGACAGGETSFEDDGDGGQSPATTGTGGAGTGGMATGGDGGSGGGDTGLCDVDCSTIQTPDCKIAVCNEGQHMGTIGECVVVDGMDGTACDDGMFCTVNDSCVAGVCEGGPANDCGIEAAPCEVVTCDEGSATCTTAPAMNGEPCTATNLCEVNATCTNGVCGGQLKDCFFAPVPDECHVAVCNPANGVCEAVQGNDGQPCTDANDLCTVGKVCDSGTCSGGSPKDCSALTQGCFNGVCNTMDGQCFGDPIMPGQNCAEATDSCNQGICDMNGNCVGNPINEGGACDDGLTCTAGETCTMGVCGGGMSTINIVFSEDFSSNSAGWTLGTEWGIGPAMASPPRGCGNPDPAMDTSSSADNGVAGVVIGGMAAQVIHPTYYITSPPMDTSAVAGSLFLSYQRWLNSDYTPYMQNFVEVYDGTTWNVVWQTGSSPGIQDSAWALQSHDITAFKATNMQVRFGFLIGSGGVFNCASWNIDDVLIADGTCN